MLKVVSPPHSLIIAARLVTKGSIVYIAKILDHSNNFTSRMLLSGFTVTSTEGLTLTCAAAFGFSIYQTGTEDLRTVFVTEFWKITHMGAFDT